MSSPREYKELDDKLEKEDTEDLRQSEPIKKQNESSKYKTITIVLLIFIVILISVIVTLMYVNKTTVNQPSSSQSSSNVSTTIDPSNSPTVNPLQTVISTVNPTKTPVSTSTNPTVAPTKSPAKFPTYPVAEPTTDPSIHLTIKPTLDPSEATTHPTKHPSNDPTYDPTKYPTKNPSKNPSGSPTNGPSPAPTVSPTPSPTTPYPTFSGENSFGHGYNVWNDEIAGSMIIDITNGNNIQQWNSDTESCSYSSMVFDKSYNSYYSYSNGWSTDISTEFNIPTEAGDVNVKGSLSATSTTMRTVSTSSDLYYYTTDIKCIVSQSSIVSYSKVIWTDDFIIDLSRLPTIFSLETAGDFTSFFETYGTHISKSAKFGGKIKATLASYKCSVLSKFQTSFNFQSALNIEMSGNKGEGSGSYQNSKETQKELKLSTSTSKFEVVGGSVSAISHSLNNWAANNASSRIIVFSEWLSTLNDKPTIIAGNLDPIYDAIRWCVNSGQHNLNIDNDKLLNISIAMKQAYKYREEILQSLITNNPCNFECNAGWINKTVCQCKCDMDGTYIVIHFFNILFAIILLFVMQ